MAKFPWRRWNNILHRDIGYLFFGMTVIYAVSGFVLNHVKSDGWHHDYIKSSKEVSITLPDSIENLIEKIDDSFAKNLLIPFDEQDNYRNYMTSTESDELTVFFKNGTLTVDLTTGEGFLDKKTPMYLIKEFNLLHYNNIKKIYTYFSDIYAAALLFLAISGLFVLKGKKGITGRGAWMTAIGLIIPILFIYFYS